jgi:hypothetical protein
MFPKPPNKPGVFSIITPLNRKQFLEIDLGLSCHKRNFSTVLPGSLM